MREFKWSRSCRWAVAVISATVLACGWGRAQQQGEPPTLVLNPIQSILAAHHAWTHVPESIRITGTSTRGTTTGPVSITATRREEAMVERGAKKAVSTPTALGFADDGEKSTFAPTPSGFGQHDITGVYLLELLTDRGIQVGLPENVTVGDARLIRLHVKGTRTEKHYRQLTVTDEFDLYIDQTTTLLAGIERSIYPKTHPLHRTTIYWFSDYREGANGILLPHRIDTRVDDTLTESISVLAYTVDQPASADLFKPRPPQPKGDAR